MKKVLFAIALAASLFACQQATPATPPTITAFDATPSSATSGATVKLSWSATGADSVEIDQGIGVVTGSASKDVTVTSSKVFTLTAKNATDSVTKSVSVTVTGVPASGGKLKIENWPTGQTGKIGGGLESPQMIPFPITGIAADGSLEYALGASTSGQAGNIACGNQTITSSNPAARILGIGIGYALTRATVGSGSSTTGTIYVANRLFTQNGPTTNGDKVAALIYVSESTKLTGLCSGLTHNANLSAGWNYLIITFTVAASPQSGTVSASVSLPDDMKWYHVLGNPTRPTN